MKAVIIKMPEFNALGLIKVGDYVDVDMSIAPTTDKSGKEYLKIRAKGYNFMVEKSCLEIIEEGRD